MLEAGAICGARDEDADREAEAAAEAETAARLVRWASASELLEVDVCSRAEDSDGAISDMQVTWASSSTTATPAVMTAPAEKGGVRSVPTIPRPEY